MRLKRLIITELENDGVSVERFFRESWQPEDLEWTHETEDDKSFMEVHNLFHKVLRKIRTDLKRKRRTDLKRKR